MNRPYFWFYDAHERINQVFKMQQDESNLILSKLLRKEDELSLSINRLKHKIETLKREKSKSATLETEREAIRHAKENGLPRPKFRRTENINQEISELFDRIKSLRKIINDIRNKTCRYCQYPLKEPQHKENQIGEAFSHADFHSLSGYRREVIMFHTECGLSWLIATMELKDTLINKVRPSKLGQKTLLKI